MGGDPAASQMPGEDEKSLYCQDPGGHSLKDKLQEEGRII